jgi:two-component system sensor kinase FixL
LPTVIHIVDDDAQVRGATSFLLAGQGYPTHVYADGNEFLAQAKLRKGCVLLDLRMTGKSGLEVLKELGRRDVTLPVVMLSGHGNLKAAVEAMKLGAVDFVEKPYQERELIAAIERALEWAEKQRDRSHANAAAASRLQRLSPRERQVLQGLLSGLSNKVIARRLDLSPRTIEMHRASMMTDLCVTSLPEAIRLAIDAGLTPLEAEPIDTSQSGLASDASRAADRKIQPVRDGSDPTPSSIDLLEGTTDCAFLLDDDWQFTYLNANAIAVLGAGRELSHANIWDAFPLARDTKAWDHLHRAAADRQSCRFDFYEPDLGVWFHVSVRPIQSGLQVFFRDITKERTAAASLKMTDETLRLVLEAAGDGAWDWNIQTGEIAMSPRFLHRLGYEPGTVPGRLDAVRELVHPDDWPVVSRRLNDHIEGRVESYSCEYRLRGRDGSWTWNFDRGRIVERDPVSGLPSRMVGSACDVTERRRDEERAQEAFNRLALAQKNAGAGTWDLDLTSGQLRLCSRSAEMHGLPHDPLPETLDATAWEACLHPDDATKARLALELAIETGATFRTEYRTFASNGRQRWVLGLGEVVRDSLDKPVRFVGLNLDITDRKEAELELERVRSELGHLLNMTGIGAMASILAHELNQPLTAIANYARGIRRVLSAPSLADGPDVEEPLLALERSAEFAAGIVRRVRNRASLEEAVLKPERLSDVIAEAVHVAAACSPRAPVPHIEIDPGADDAMIDRVQIGQVILNLLRNAQEAMAEAGVVAPATIQARRQSDGQILVRVSDRGPGIAKEVKAKLFMPFVSTKTEGMGLGLSISRTIVEAHGGSIWADDNSPGGTALCFTLPGPAAAGTVLQ